MRITFTFYDIQEITSSAYIAFFSTFKHGLDEDTSDSDYDTSDSDLSDFDSDIFGCGEITPEVESVVDQTWEICKPLEEVFGVTTSKLIKDTVNTAKEETQCVGLKFFNDITPGENRDLIATCTEISFWCCCETIKKVSPIIAEATINLMY